MIIEMMDNNCRIVRPIGSIDMSNVREFDAALDRAFRASPGGFVIDLSETDYMDSAGLKAILAAYQRLAQTQSRLAIFISNSNVKQLLDLIRLGELPGITISDDLQSAKQAVAWQEE